MKPEGQLATTIRLVDEFGPVLAGRAAAAALRERIEDCLFRGEEVVLDFESIEAMSPSFADEVFGKLASPERNGQQLRVENLSADLAMFARFVAAHRSA